MAGHAPPAGAQMEPLVRTLPAGTELQLGPWDVRVLAAKD